jgi:hypothetical protein
MSIWRVLSGTALRLMLLFGVTIGLIRARPYDDAGLSAFLNSDPNCLAPCWNGLRPEITTFDEALLLLKSSESVRDLDSDMRQDNGHIFWQWTATRPPFLINTTEVGYASVEKNVVRGIYLPGLRSFLDTWFALGAPEQIIVYSNAFWGIQNVIYLAVYPGKLYVASAIFCSATTRDLWISRPSVFIGQMPEYSALYAFVYEPGDFQGWLPSPLC